MLYPSHRCGGRDGVMLRISEWVEEGRVAVIAVAGSVAGEEVGVLEERVVAVQASGQKLAVDLGDVTEVDQRGCALLAQLCERSAELRRVPQFISLALGQVRTGGPKKG